MNKNNTSNFFKNTMKPNLSDLVVSDIEIDLKVKEIEAKCLARIELVSDSDSLSQKKKNEINEFIKNIPIISEYLLKLQED